MHDMVRINRIETKAEIKQAYDTRYHANNQILKLENEFYYKIHALYLVVTKFLQKKHTLKIYM